MKSLTNFFPVVVTWKKVNEVKVVDEIRMVYDASKSGLNNRVFAPWFTMPTAESHLRSVKAVTYMADCDVGEMILIFMIESEVRPYAGVDLIRVFSEEASIRGWKFNVWRTTMLIGFSPSPYFVTKYMLVVEKMVKGDRLEVKTFR